MVKQCKDSVKTAMTKNFCDRKHLNSISSWYFPKMMFSGTFIFCYFHIIWAIWYGSCYMDSIITSYGMEHKLWCIYFYKMMTHKSLQTVSSKREHTNFGNCKTESVPHSCSFITGALIERIHWFTLEDWLYLFNH